MGAVGKKVNNFKVQKVVKALKKCHKVQNTKIEIQAQSLDHTEKNESHMNEIMWCDVSK